ncbi:MAG: 23S rRNA (uridine(2552)-2'-O)-methyltransferase RlmE [endosymbiont of Galathealinum brachiosum]|uniref:Ribosomal RNA large subunit methyltransferase E n=1 Tax=endosymbiont of Galathealinum brachiosum TaxID=2200906 RepID=A0A370DA78_9GAMM|nr:MAG: 23S rRNA (uridine(2552)-2'-O)-methyltransferase RlmE [endosymbiont of Galathealinum brachiosum]
MARSKSSGNWLKEHFDDEFVKQSQKDGYRSRAVYKLKEIDEKDYLLKPGSVVIDLGAAPGSWCEYVVRKLKGRGRIIALDILPMDPMEGVEIITGDFLEEEIFDELLNTLGSDKPDLVICDMAPNMSGQQAVDIPRAMYMAELALDLSQQVLKPEGGLLVKLFQGEGFDEYVKQMRLHFNRVVMRKPKASRARSKEVYGLATGFKG